MTGWNSQPVKPGWRQKLSGPVSIWWIAGFVKISKLSLAVVWPEAKSVLLLQTQQLQKIAQDEEVDGPMLMLNVYYVYGKYFIYMYGYNFKNSIV